MQSAQPISRSLVPDGRDRLGALTVIGNSSGSVGTDELAWLVVQEGEASIIVDGVRHEVPTRSSVFEGPGWSALIGAGSSVRVDGSATCLVVWRTLPPGSDATTRVIDPTGVRTERRGDGPTIRLVRTYIDAGPLIVGETLNPPGGWSSWPPHQHDHEEIYCYRFEPSHAFGVHLDLGADPTRPDADRPQVVRDGDVVRISSGHHPVVAAPGCSMYYAWALAGDGPLDTLVDARFDPGPFDPA